MTDEQVRAYGDATRIKSDPFGVLDRANRNHWKKLRLITDEMAAGPGESVLEVGCGDGLHAARLDKRYDYVGVDFSPTLIDTAAERVTDGHVLVMDATDLSFPSNRFDSVVGNAVLHHFANPARALKEWVRVTRPGGSVTVMEPNYAFPKDFVETHLVPEERHKRKIAPWRLPRIIKQVPHASYSVTPTIYTPPLPERAGRLYDVVDRVAGSVPGARWLSQLLLIDIRVE